MKPSYQVPEHLKKHGAKLWSELVSEYGIHDAAGQALLTQAAECLDRLREAQSAIAKHGAIVKDRYGSLKANPACTTEKDARNGFLAALRMLNFDVEPLRDAPGRPAGTFGRGPHSLKLRVV